MFFGSFVHVDGLLGLEEPSTANAVELAWAWLALVDLEILEFLLVFEIFMDLIMMFAVMLRFETTV